MKNEHILLVFLILSFIFIVLSLPIYDRINGFHNIVLDDYILTWYDGRSPANFHIIKNIIKNGSISFTKGYLIGDIPVENHYDFLEEDGKYYPAYFFFGDYIYASILYFFQFSSDIQLFKAMMMLNIAFFASILIIFYHTQRLLGLKLKYCCASTLIAGFATSILIYCRYLFIKDTLSTLFFSVIIYAIIKSQKKPSIKTDALIIIFFLSLFILSRYVYRTEVELLIIIFMVILYLIFKYKLISLKKPYLFIIILGIILIVFSHSFYSFYRKNIFLESTSISSKDLYPYLIPNYIPALDFIVYGYHDPSSVWKLDRFFPMYYTFQQLPGNAIFHRGGYSFYVSLFGPKGIIFNSPFLIFSVLGIFLYKSGKNKIIILSSILLFILIYGLFYGMLYGGVTPRYNRFLTIPVLFLTFFSFYYVQRTNNFILKLLFIYAVILSLLNVTSLAVRADWTYEHEADLVSYDWVLWPWYPLEKMTNITNQTTILLNSKEIPNWSLSGEGPCKATFGGMGLVTDTCYCTYDSWAERKIELDKDIGTIEVQACSAIAGNDGTKGLIYIDDELIGEIFIQSDSCRTKKFSVIIHPGVHTIKLKSGKYGKCDGEMVFWKSIKFEEKVD
jgi:hypothetical protein